MLQGRGVQTSVIQTRISGSQKNLFHPLNNLSIKYLNYTKTAGFDPGKGCKLFIQTANIFYFKKVNIGYRILCDNFILIKNRNAQEHGHLHQKKTKFEF